MSSEFRRALFAVSIACLFPTTARADIIISEIMYNPSGGGSHEYVEIHNSGAASIDLGGWKIDSGISYEFPAFSIGAGEYLVVAGRREVLLLQYPGLNSDSVIGDFVGGLENGGETLTLVRADGSIAEQFSYDDDHPWDAFADGFGASLERVCYSTEAGDHLNWRASAIPADGMSGGTPGVGGEIICPPAAPSRMSVQFSEIMYHPVLEESHVERHEFFEVHNSSENPVDVSGWRILGGVEYTFPPDSVIAANGYAVIAKDRAALASVEAYALNEADLFGDYERELDNGGERLAMVDASGVGVDFVIYDDDSPWPVAADALGAGASWLAADLLPLEDHRYMGYSLERLNYNQPGVEVANWELSQLDGATPGRANSASSEILTPVVNRHSVIGEGGPDELIRSSDEVLLQVSFSPRPPESGAEVEFFVDDIARTDESPLTLPLFDDGSSGGDIFAGDGVFTATLPAREDNSIVRYRILADHGEGMAISSPRPRDPFAWHAYFVSPVIDTQTETYQLFISPANWGQIYNFASGGRASGCSARANWNRKVSAVFVHEGEVHDVRVRYQGSRWNRLNGRDIRSWRVARPSAGPLRALSWRMSFPRFNQFDGRSAVTLNKLNQSCPGYNSGVGYRLYAMADLPSPKTQYIRYHINGQYYHYMMEYERPGEEMIRRYNREMAEKYPDLPREEVGNLHKSAGCNCDEGPYGWGDARLLPPRCGFTVEDRFAATYDRKTNEWDDYSEIIRMVNALHQSRRGSRDDQRAFFEEFFDVDMLLDYMVIMNWSVPFDDMFQNHFLYQRTSDGRWMFAPWDLDRNYGEWRGANSSIYCGEQGDSSNRSGWWNYIKDTFLKSHREDFDLRMFVLNNTLLHPDNIAKLVDEVTAEANPQEAAASPAGLACSFGGRANSFKSYALQRFNVVNSGAGPTVEAGPDQTVFVGETVQFDASASSPDEDAETPYLWDNGMVGEMPTFVFDEPGSFVVTLTIPFLGIEFKDEVTISVLPVPESAFQESNGLVVFEGESFFDVDNRALPDVSWEIHSDLEGFSGAGYAEARELIRRRSFLSRYGSTAPELRYAIIFENPGTYRVWVRAFVPTSSADTLHVNLASTERSSNLALQLTPDETQFLWHNETRREGPMEIEVVEPGMTYLSVWMRESGLSIDKIILTQDTAMVPEGEGPVESPAVPLGAKGAFVRGDVDGSGTLNISDAVGILSYLFRGQNRVSCEDHGDVDDNGNLEITDAISLLNFLFLGGRSPAAPFPQPGFDPTADENDCGDGDAG